MLAGPSTSAVIHTEPWGGALHPSSIAVTANRCTPSTEGCQTGAPPEHLCSQVHAIDQAVEWVGSSLKSVSCKFAGASSLEFSDPHGVRVGTAMRVAPRRTAASVL